MIEAVIDNQPVKVEEGTTILEAAEKVNINIPTLCYSEELSIYGGCRLCVVDIEGEDGLKPSCGTEIQEGMEIKTHSNRVRKVRRTLFELIIASHNISCRLNCLTCSRNNSFVDHKFYIIKGLMTLALIFFR